MNQLTCYIYGNHKENENNMSESFAKKNVAQLSLEGTRETKTRTPAQVNAKGRKELICTSTTTLRFSWTTVTVLNTLSASLPPCNVSCSTSPAKFSMHCRRREKAPWNATVCFWRKENTKKGQGKRDKLKISLKRTYASSYKSTWLRKWIISTIAVLFYPTISSFFISSQ